MPSDVELHAMLLDAHEEIGRLTLERDQWKGRCQYAESGQRLLVPPPDAHILSRSLRTWTPPAGLALETDDEKNLTLDAA